MAESTAIYEMISAFVLGCMNRENYDNFKNYNDNNGKLPLNDFSEFQIMVSLIPTLLETSKPDPKIKDLVAKNILSYQEDIKAKIRADKTATISSTQSIPGTKTIIESIDSLKKPVKQPVAKTNLEEKIENKNESESKPVKPQVKVEQPRKEELRKEELRNKKPLTLESEKKANLPEISKSSKTVWYLFLLILIITIAASIYFYIGKNNLKNKTAELNREIILLKADMRKGNEYIKTNKKIVDFLNYDNIDIINLEKRDNSTNASGKLLIAFSKKEALLDAENLPVLPKGKIFQLWLITKDISYPLLKFTPAQGQKFYSMPKLPYVPKSEVDLIRITVEPDSGSEYPAGNTILFGGFLK